MHTLCEYVWKPEGNPRGIPQLFLETASLAGLELLDKLGMVTQDPFISTSPVLGLQTQATVPGSLKNFKIFCLQGKEFTYVVIIPAQWEGSSCLQCVKTLFTIHAHLFIHSLISMCTVHIHDCVVCSHTREGVGNLCDHEYRSQREVWYLSVLIAHRFFFFFVRVCVFLVCCFKSVYLAEPEAH